MALRTIVTTPEPVLRHKAKTVTKFDENLQTLIDHGSREILSLSRSHSDLFAFPLATLET